jgi:hypothetical protein
MTVSWIIDGEERESVPIAVFWHDEKMWAIVCIHGQVPIVLQIEKKDLSPNYYGWTQ